MSIVAKEINRRRHIRWKIEKHAMLVAPCSKPVSCTIYDFCSSGLFLEFEQADEEIVMHQRLRRQAKILFSTGVQGGKEDFQFDVEIMRVCSNGVGVAFQQIPMSAFQALVKEANLVTVPVSLANLEHVPDQVKKERFEKAFRSLLGECLPIILKEFFSQIDKELIKKSREAGNDAAKEVFLNAFATLKSNQKEIVAKFCNSLLKEIQYLDNSMSEEKVDSLNNYEDKQSAVNKGEISDWIDLSCIIRRTESKFESQLNILEQKLSYVSGIPANQINNPVAPAKLFYSFRASIEYPDENNEVMKVFNYIFEGVLVSQLDKLYTQFDSVLTGQGAPEQLGCQSAGQSDKSQKKDNSLDQLSLIQDQSVRSSAARNIQEEIQESVLSKA